MTIYEIYSKRNDCSFQFKYGVKGILIGFDITEERELDGEALAGILNIGLTEKKFLYYTKNKSIPVVKILQDISFDNFWNTYNYKEGGSKKKAEAAFLKLSEKDKSAALNYIQKYKRIKAKEGTALAYATTYINGQLWNN